MRTTTSSSGSRVTVTSRHAGGVGSAFLGGGRQRRDESLLRDLDPPHHLHPTLAFLLLLEQLALTGDVTAVALGEHVLADGADVFAGDDAGADRSLDGHFELLPRNELAQFRRHSRAIRICLFTVHDRAERVDSFTLKQD